MTTAMARLSFYLQDPEGNWLEMLYEPPTGIVSNQPAFNQIATNQAGGGDSGAGLSRNRGRNPGLAGVAAAG